MSGFINGNSPLRLLREKWDSATSLAQELYAMSQAKGPVELNNTLTIRVPEHTTALKIERQQAGDSYDFGQRNTLTKQQIAAAAAGRENPPGSARKVRPQDPRRAGGPESLDAARQGLDTPGSAYDPSPTRPMPDTSTPLIEVSGGVKFTGNDPVTFSRPPLIQDPTTGRATSLADFTRKVVQDANRSPGSASVFMGKVVGPDKNSAAQTFAVALYTSGPDGAVGSTVSVKVPQLAADEVIPPGTWIAPIFLIAGKYYCQVPVWME